MKRHGLAGKYQRGFTLFEIMIVLVLALIIFAIGIPNYNRFRRIQATKSAAAAFVADLEKAKAEAKAKEAYVFVVFDNAGGRTGYKIVEDEDEDGPSNDYTPNVGFKDLYTTYLGTTISSPDTGNYLGFGPNGEVYDESSTNPSDPKNPTWSPTSVPGVQDYWTVRFDNTATNVDLDVRIYKNGKIEIRQ